MVAEGLLIMRFCGLVDAKRAGRTVGRIVTVTEELKKMPPKFWSLLGGYILRSVISKKNATSNKSCTKMQAIREYETTTALQHGHLLR